MCLEFGTKLPPTLSLCWLCFWWFCQPHNRPQRTQSQSTTASHSWHNISFDSRETLYPNCILHGLQSSIYLHSFPQLKWYLVPSMFPAIVCPVNPFNDEANGLSSHWRTWLVFPNLPARQHTHPRRSFSTCSSRAEKNAQVSSLPLTSASENITRPLSHPQRHGSCWVFSTGSK